MQEHLEPASSRAVEGRGETLIFLHLPKTAGQTFMSILLRQYPSRVVRLEPDRETDRRWLRLPEQVREANREGAAVITGHFRYGIHRWVEGPCRYVTFLREPVDRVLSHYYYQRERPENPQHDLVRSIPGGLAGAVAHEEYTQLQNMQTRMLAGVPEDGNLLAEQELPDDEMLARAKRNLEACAIVGLTERFDETLAMMATTLGWRTPVYASRNTTRQRPKVDALPPDIQELVRERNALDLALYEQARVLFEQNWARHRAEAERELRRLRVANVVHQATHSDDPRLRLLGRMYRSVRRAAHLLRRARFLLVRWFRHTYRRRRNDARRIRRRLMSSVRNR